MSGERELWRKRRSRGVIVYISSAPDESGAMAYRSADGSWDGFQPTYWPWFAEEFERA